MIARSGRAHKRRIRQDRRIVIAISAVAFFVLASTGVAFGAWNTSSPVTGSVTAASTSISVAGTTGLSYSYQFTGAASLSPVIIKPITVSNTGMTPLTYTLAVTNVTSSAFASQVKLSVWLQVAGVCGVTVPTGSNTGTLAVPPALPAGTTSAASGASFILCAATSMNTTVAGSNGFTVNSTLTVNGQVGVSNWRTAGSGTFVQNSATLCGAGATLLGLLGVPVILSWPTPAGAGPYSYRVIIAGSPGPTIVMPSQTQTSVSIQYANMSSFASPQSLQVQASSDGFATLAMTVNETVTFQPGVIGVLLASVNCVSSP